MVLWWKLLGGNKGVVCGVWVLGGEVVLGSGAVGMGKFGRLGVSWDNMGRLGGG